MTFNKEEFLKYVEGFIKDANSTAKVEVEEDGDYIFLMLTDEENTNRMFILHLNILTYLDSIGYDLKVIEGLNPCILKIAKKEN